MNITNTSNSTSNTTSNIADTSTSVDSTSLDSTSVDKTGVIGATLKEQLALLGEHLGQFKAYDSQLPLTEIAGTRTVKCLYQVSPKTGKKIQENAYCRLPVSHLTEETVLAKSAELAPFVLGWLQSIEDAMIKEDHKNGITQVFTEYLSLDKIIAHLEETSTSGRLTKEKVEAWFTDKLEDSLFGRVAEKLGFTVETLDAASENDLEKLAKIVGAYKAKFATLASPKAFINEADCKAMIALISKVDDAASSVLGMRFITRLESISKKEDDLLLAL